MSSPDMFNFYVILADHDMVNDAGRATTCRRKFKVPLLQTKITKKAFRKWVPRKNRSKISDETKIQYTSNLHQTTPWRTRPLDAAIEDGPCNGEEINWGTIEKKHSD